MTIKEVYDIIEDLKKDRENFMKIQEFCLGHMSKNPNDGAHTRIYGVLEDEADLNISLRTLASKTIGNIDKEINRLNKIIENTQVKIY